MSALLFALRQDKIDILVDTKAIGCSNMAKVWSLVHLPAIICGRGPAALILDVALRSAAIAASFDELARTMPAVIDAALKAGTLNLAHLSPRDRRAEIYLAGISPSTSRPTVHTFTLTDSNAATASYERTDESGDFLLCAPWIDRLGPVPEVAPGMSEDDLSAMLQEIHDRQIRLMNEECAAESAGGRRVLITITAGSIASEIAEE